MYIVSRSSDEKYGNVIAILRAEDGEISPFLTVEEAKKEKRLWEEQELIKSRFMVDGQILTTSGLNQWAREEYQNLPKCNECGKILYGKVYVNRLSNNYLFCTQFCADSNYHQQLYHLNDYEEFDL